MTISSDNNYGFRFRDWDIYKDAREFRNGINKFLKTFPKEEKYALIDQAKRALNSVILNIAEGSNKNTDKDACVYINRAHCSLDEVIACLDCALDDKYINKEQHQEILLKASSIAKRLNSFTNYLASNKEKSKINDQIKSRINDQGSMIRGVAALPTIIIVAMIILLAGIGAASSGFVENLISYSELESKKALFAAEAGAKDAFKRIGRNKNCNTENPITCASYSIAVGDATSTITVSGTNDKTILSSGQVGNIEVKIQVETYFDANNKLIQSSWKQID